MKWIGLFLMAMCAFLLFKEVIFQPKQERERIRFIHNFNSVYEDYNTWLFINANSLLNMREDTFILHLKTLYPQYQKPIIDRHQNFAIVFFEGRNFLPVDYKYRKNAVSFEPSTIYFPTQTTEPLEESMTIQRMIDECNTDFQVDRLLKRLQDPKTVITTLMH